MEVQTGKIQGSHTPVKVKKSGLKPKLNFRAHALNHPAKKPH